jgi:hypothetical protein
MLSSNTADACDDCPRQRGEIGKNKQQSCSLYGNTYPKKKACSHMRAGLSLLASESPDDLFQRFYLRAPDAVGHAEFELLHSYFERFENGI